MELIIHVGAYKTGSSSLQSFLAKNQGSLAENGILYPLGDEFTRAVSGKITSGNSSTLARFLMSESDASFPKTGSLDEEIGRLLLSLRDKESSKIIISSEFFFSATEKKLNIFYESIRGVFSRIRVICYLRRQDHFIEALYAQRIKRHSETRSFEEVFPEESWNQAGFQYFDRIQAFTQICNPRDIIARPYVRSSLKNGDIIDDFFSSLELNIPVNAVYPKYTINITPEAEVLAFMRVLNSFGSSAPFNDELTDVIGRLQGFLNFGNLSLLTGAARKRMLERFSDGNRKLIETYDFPNTFIDDPSIDVAESAASDKFPANEILLILGGLLVSQYRRSNELQDEIDKLRKEFEGSKKN